MYNTKYSDQTQTKKNTPHSFALSRNLIARLLESGKLAGQERKNKMSELTFELLPATEEFAEVDAILAEL